MCYLQNRQVSPVEKSWLLDSPAGIKSQLCTQRQGWGLGVQLWLPGEGSKSPCGVIPEVGPMGGGPQGIKYEGSPRPRTESL